MTPQSRTFYQHRYGGLYKTVDYCTSKSTADQSIWVVYEHVYPFDAGLYHRPIDEFADGRFTEVDLHTASLLMAKDAEAFKAEIAANKAAAKNP